MVTQKFKFKCWKKDKWDKDGRWSNIRKHKEIAIGHAFAGVRHIFYTPDTRKTPSGSRTLKVVKTKSQAINFVKSYMQRHNRC